MTNQLNGFNNGTYSWCADTYNVNETFTITTTGLSTNQNGTASYQMFNNMVTLSIPALSGTSNSTSFTLTGLPAEIRPSTTRNIGAMQVTSAGVNIVGSGSISSSGVITLSAGTLGTLFGALLGKGVAAQDISYLVG